MPTPEGTTLSITEMVAAVDPDQESRPLPAYQFSNGRKFEAGAYPKGDDEQQAA